MRIEQRVGFLVCAACLFVLSFGTPSLADEGGPAASQAPARVEGSNYEVGAGDLLQIVVWKNPEVSGEFRVRPDGKFSMPLIGDILAAGKSTDSISMQVEQKLKLFIELPYVSTIVREANSNRIFVLGEVARPGVYPIDDSLTVLQALALAGGFTEFARKDELILVRGKGETQQKFPLSYREILRASGDKYNLVLQRGDTLVVQ